MTPTRWLRAASVIVLIHAILHTIGGVYGTPDPGPQQIAVSAMKSNTFPFMGHTRSMWAFYHGMGLAVTIFLTLEAVVFWILGNLVRGRTDLRDLLVVFVIGYFALAANSLRYFFYPPVVVELMIAACLIMAILSIKQRSTNTV